jgi:hypothetical protein
MSEGAGLMKASDRYDPGTVDLAAKAFAQWLVESDGDPWEESTWTDGAEEEGRDAVRAAVVPMLDALADAGLLRPGTEAREERGIRVDAADTSPAEVDELMALLGSMPKPLADALDNLWNAGSSASNNQDFRYPDGSLNEDAYLRYKINLIKATWDIVRGNEYVGEPRPGVRDRPANPAVEGSPAANVLAEGHLE